MALTYRGAATIQAGSTSCTVGVPSGTVAGDLTLLFAATKLSSADPTDPTGWYRVGSWVVGTGADGAGTGQIRLTLWRRVWTWTETPGSVVVTNASGNSMLAGAASWGKAASDAAFHLYASSGSDITSGTSFTATMSANLGFVTNDHAMIVGATTDDLTDRNTDGWTVPGVTFPAPTFVAEAATTIGNDLHVWLTRVGAATAGTQSAANDVTATLDQAGTGGAITVRVSLTVSGTAHTQTPADALGPADTSTRVKVIARSQTDSSGLAETRGLTQSKVLTESVRPNDPFPTAAVNGTPLDFTAGTLTLGTVWLNLADDLSDFQAFPTMSKLVAGTESAQEARKLAGGRIRLVRQYGNAHTFRLILRACDRDQVAWLEDHVGDLMCVRDDRGRKVYGVYANMNVDEFRTAAELGDVAVDFEEVTHEEGLDPL